MVQHFTIVFAVVLIGYFVLSRSNLYRERLLTSSNYVVLYESAISGGALFFVSWFVLTNVKRYFFECDDLFGPESTECALTREFPFPFFDVLLGCTWLAGVSIALGNRAKSKDKVSAELARASGLIANELLDALDGSHLVQITTVRGKVYIGWILRGPGISMQGKVEDIAIVPLLSGHRDPETQQVRLDLDYTLALREYEKIVRHENESGNLDSRRNSEMSVVIPMVEIALIRRHSEELSDMFLPVDDLDNDTID